MLEIKCPYKWRLLTPRATAQDKIIFFFFCDFNSKGLTTSIYYYQIQGLMALQTKEMRLCDMDIQKFISNKG